MLNRIWVGFILIGFAASARRCRAISTLRARAERPVRHRENRLRHRARPGRHPLRARNGRWARDTYAGWRYNTGPSLHRHRPGHPGLPFLGRGRAARRAGGGGFFINLTPLFRSPAVGGLSGRGAAPVPRCGLCARRRRHRGVLTPLRPPPVPATPATPRSVPAAEQVALVQVAAVPGQPVRRRRRCPWS